MSGHNKGVFIARDGVLIPKQPQRKTVVSSELVPGSVEGISRIRALGFTVFIVTNDEDVCHGTIKEIELEDLHGHLVCAISELDSNAFIDGVFYCVHHPEAKLQEYRKKCDCRLPKPGLLEKAAGDFSVDLSRSFMIGDHESLVITGHLAGGQSILIKSPGNNDLDLGPIDSSLPYDPKVAEPDMTFNNLTEAADWLANKD
ncbi:MAG: HAD-IIIA family hydrolase [Myxococcota bacterium]|nr:HAD-IIIA family hydrolase [Myxococcota bacterium]